MLSYLVELPIEKRQSIQSGEVSVTLHFGQYKLSTARAIYSFGTHYTSFSRAFEALDMAHRNAAKVLVLGFGLGSVVDLLRQNASVREVCAVDADPVIIELAKQYLHTDANLQPDYVAADAADFVAQCRQRFDLVLFDVFIDDVTPEAFLHEEFLRQLRELVAAGGLLLFSKIDVSASDKIENDFFERLFSGVFPSAFSVSTDGNKVFAWQNNAD